MEKRKQRSRAVYRKPLPIDLCVDEEGQLPALIVHNPVSWLYLAYKLALIYIRQPPQASNPLIMVEAHKCEDIFVFQVHQENDMVKLWTEGFFGKGTLSRSDPSWHQRVQRRLKLDTGIEVTKEEVTHVRRQERKKYKEIRSQVQKYEALERQDKLSTEDRQNWELLKDQMENIKHIRQEFTVGDDESEWRKEDQELLNENMEIQQLESLQLQRVEVFFLAFALDVVQVEMSEIYDGFDTDEQNHASASCERESNKRPLCPLSVAQLFVLCCPSPVPDHKFIIDYVVYHHFRSLGWCARSGIKFGCDYLLYKKGPPYLHAEYGVMVVPNNNAAWKSWEDFMSVSRVVSGVRKTLVLVYVDIPLAELFDQHYRNCMNKNDFIKLFQLYKITEIISKRWLPSRTRD